MAISAVNAYSADGSNLGSPHTLSSRVAVGNRLVLVTILMKAANISTATVSLSWMGLTWTLLGSVSQGTGYRTMTWYAITPASPTANAPSFTYSGGGNGTSVWSIDEFNNYDAATPIGVSATGSPTNTLAPSVTLATFQKADSATFGAFGYDGLDFGSLSPGSGFTQLSDRNNTGSNGELFVEWRNTPDTSVDIAAASSTDDWANVAAEIRASSNRTRQPITNREAVNRSYYR